MRHSKYIRLRGDRHYLYETTATRRISTGLNQCMQFHHCLNTNQLAVGLDLRDGFTALHFPVRF